MSQPLHDVALGTRVVVRYLIEGGERATDALGHITSRTSSHLTVETRTGPVVIPTADIVAGKPIPAPPQRTRRGEPEVR